MRSRGATLAAAAVLGFALAGPASAYDTPVQQSSPWPTMRHDRRNTGSSPIIGRYTGGRPWAFRTGKGIFSTPVVAGNGTIFVGSADTYFYALTPSGRLRWRFKTGNLIDSAGFIGRYDPKLRTVPVVVPSGDEHLYELRSDTKRMPHAERIIWSYYAKPAGTTPGQLVTWWEGNAEPGPDGTIYAGNTGDAAYALHPDGTLKWVHRSFGPFWTDPAIAADGTTFWGSLDLFVHRLDAAGGNDVWRVPTLGFVISSPALSQGGTLYIGSFDSNLYAINSTSGRVLWEFPTGDHIYSSPALDEDANGNVRQIIVASTDGQVYAVSPAGRELWSYDTGDVIRSSPVLGMAPDGMHRIVYVGAGNGTLYALNAQDGTRRWSFDTTRSDPVLHDRNDLNASPALTRTGVVIGGEDGYVKYIPYDYCLHHADARCDTTPGSVFPAQLDAVFPVTSGGNTQLGSGTQQVGPAAVLPVRLVVRKDGRTQDAAMSPLLGAASLVRTSPAFPFTAQVSGDGHYLFVVPDGLLKPDTDYSIRVHGTYTANGVPLGNIRLAGTSGGRFDQTLRYHVGPAGAPLRFSTSAAKVTAFRLSRLAFPLPSFAPSVNQIGFDSYDMVVGTLAATPPDASGSGSLLLWAVGATPGPGGTDTVDPSSLLAFPLAGTYRGNSIALSAQGVTLTFSFGPVPVQRMELRAQMSPSLVAQPGADIYGEVACLLVPTYGPLLPTQRLCNNQLNLVTNGTFVTAPYPRTGTANQAPPGLTVGAVTLKRPTLLSPGSAVATLAHAPGTSYPAGQHVVSIVLVDTASGQPVGLDYKADTAELASNGSLEGVRLTIPAATTLPARVRAYVVADVFPLAVRDF